MTYKKITGFLMSRLFVVSFSIFLQIVFLVSVVTFLSAKLFFLYLLFQIISLAVVVWINSKSDNPSFKIPWIIIILIVPLVGGIFYLLWGNKRLPQKLIDRLEQFFHTNLENLQVDSGCEAELSSLDPQLSVQASYIKRATGFPIWKNTASEFFALGDQKYPRLLEELKKAERFIFLEYFIISPGLMWDSILAILRDKVQEGVEVRVMFDDIGTINTLPDDYAGFLRGFGIGVTVFNPFEPHLNMAMNYRDHRKICVIDGNVGFCGGANIADEYINALPRFGHWKDTAVLLKGEGVWNLTLMFLTLWNFSVEEGSELPYSPYVPTIACKTDGFVQPFGDSPLDNFNVAESAYLQMINRATDYLYLTSPYLVLDNEMITALTMAAEGGVDVRIITPHIPDKWYVHLISRSYYGQLVRSGVKIYEYKPGFIHAKQFVSDDKVAIVGTTNLDFRSFYLQFECGVSFYLSSTVEMVKQDILSTLEVCHEVTPEEALEVPLGRRLLAAVLRIFAPLV